MAMVLDPGVILPDETTVRIATAEAIPMIAATKTAASRRDVVLGGTEPMAYAREGRGV